MKRVRRSLLLLPLLLAVPQLMEAADYLFVFQPGSNVQIYDADTMQLLGAPAVGAGAVHAIGVDDASNPGELEKIFVVTTSAVVVLEPEPPFAIRRTLSLVGSISRGERSALLTPDGRLLMVIVDRDLQFVPSAEGVVPASTTVNMGANVTGATISADSRRARVITEDSDRVRSVGLTTTPPQRLAGPLQLPAVPVALQGAPNGTALYAATDGSLFEITPESTALAATISTEAGAPLAIVFDPDSPVDTAFVNLGSELLLMDLPGRRQDGSFVPLPPAEAIRKAVSPGLDRVFLMTPQRVLRGVPSVGTLTELIDPRTGSPFLLPPVDLEVDPKSEHLFVAFGTAGSIGSVAKLSANGAFFQADVTPAAPPTGIAVVAAQGTTPADFEIYGGNHQILLESGPLPQALAVRVRDAEGRPVADEEVSFSSSRSSTDFDPQSPQTNGNGVAVTFVRAPVTTPFEITAELESNGQTVIFNVNQGPQGEEAINKISGDYQVVLGGDPLPLPLGVRALANGAPVANLDLTSDDLATNTSCAPVSQTTDTDGEASFDCSAPMVVINRSLQVQVTDSFGRSLTAPFEITAVPTVQELPAIFPLLSERRLTGMAGQTLPDAIRLSSFDANGKLVERAGIQFTSDDDVMVHPPLAVIQPGGAVADITFGCTLGDGTITATLNEPGLREQEISFTTIEGPPAVLTNIEGDFQSGDAGQLLDAAGQRLVALLQDGCGNPLARIPVEWEVSPPGAATLESAVTRTTPFGQLFAEIRLGNQPGPLEITARVGGLTTTFNLFVNTIAAQMLVVSGDGQTAVVGQPAPLPLVVRLLDEQGAPAPSSGVEFSILQGSATLSAETVPTDIQGQAAVLLEAGPVAGLVQVEARVGNLRQVFTVTVVGRTPVATSAAFVNGGSFVLGWVPGSAGSIFGTGLSEIQGVVQATTFPFPTELAGVRVLVNGVAAPILAVARVNGVEQINIQVPFETPAPSEDVEVTIENNGASTTISGVRTLAVQPGIFELPSAGGRVAAALHLDFSLVDPSNPARPGETILLFLTGMGVTDPAVGTNVLGPEPAAATVEPALVTISGLAAEVLGTFYGPGLATAYQTNLVVPEEAPTGNLTIVITAAGIASQEAILPVAP